jgi:diguanylate cyclase (GGDEF)-like protein
MHDRPPTGGPPASAPDPAHARSEVDRRRPRAPASAVKRVERGVWACYGILAVCLLAYVVLVIVRSDGQTWPALDTWGVDAFELIGSALCLVRAAVSPRDRHAVAALGLGLLAWTIGDIALHVESLGGATPSVPSVADGFYLFFYPVTYVGLMLMIRRQVRRFDVSMWLDGAIAGLGAAAACAAFAFHGIEVSAGGGAAAVATNLAYPVGDLLLLGLVVAGTAIVPRGQRRGWLMVAAGFAVNVLGDTSNLFQSSFGSSHVGSAVNAVAWPTYILLVSASVWLRPAHSAPQAQERSPGFLLPGLAAASALVILFTGSLHHVGLPALLLAVATLVVAGVRSGLSLVNLRALTEQRHRNSITDQLTGLGNRRALSALLDVVLPDDADPDAPPQSVAFLFIDLNGFKQVNDSFGHAAGDDLLRQLGARLQGALRREDLLVRLGGDEFGVVLVDGTVDDAAMVAQRLVARLDPPFVLEGIRARVGASIGIAAAPTDATSAPDLLRCADLAMYRAKLAGNSFAIYQEDLDGSGDRRRLAEELSTAIEERQFELHYQPQVELSTGQIVAAEALLRWPHPRLGLVAPLAFLPLAEESGLMGPLTRLVLDDALEQCAAWRAEGRDLTVAVNTSPTNLLEPGFVDMVEQLLEQNRLGADALVLEVTETAPIADLEQAKDTIERLRTLGVVVSVDDFGAGFTSLAYLGSLAVGELKLDRSFITELTKAQAGRDVTLVRSTIDLAHSLGLRVVAEGVEDEEALELLAGLGCDLAQGYLISKPKPASELVLPRAAPARG